MDDAIWLLDPDTSLVIRTDFRDADGWTSIQAAISEPQTEDEFLAYVEFIDDEGFAEVTPAQIVAAAPPRCGHKFVFVVDAEALNHPERPVLVVSLREPGETFRIIPSEMWGVQNNLPIANMDWSEFADAADADGIFRGFPE